MGMDEIVKVRALTSCVEKGGTKFQFFEGESVLNSHVKDMLASVRM